MKSKKAEEYIDESTYDAAELVDKDGCGWAVVRRHDAYRAAFAELIDRVSGRGTYDRNPYVVAYEFELLR